MGEQGVRPRESQPDSSNCVYFHLWIVSSIFRFLGLKERHREGRKGGREGASGANGLGACPSLCSEPRPGPMLALLWTGDCRRGQTGLQTLVITVSQMAVSRLWPQG